jgi:hypothetical protein
MRALQSAPFLDTAAFISAPVVQLAWEVTSHHPNPNAYYAGPIMHVPEHAYVARWTDKGSAAAPHIIAYMNPQYRAFLPMVSAIGLIGWPAHIVAPGVDRSFADLCARKSHGLMEITSEPIDIAQSIYGDTVIITHGSPGTVSESLRLGIPPIMIPETMDQAHLSRIVSNQQLGIFPHTSELEEAIRFHAPTHESYTWQRAHDFADQLKQANFSYERSAQHAANAILCSAIAPTRRKLP